jgi:hypothetical protein
MARTLGNVVGRIEQLRVASRQAFRIASSTLVAAPAV